MRRIETRICPLALGAAALVAAMALPGCAPPRPDEDLGPIDAIVEPGDRIDWPGVDRASGRVVPLIRGFGNGAPAAYWFLGFAFRGPADVYFFCREGEARCPLDEHERLSWDRLVGNPLFSSIPGDEGFAPFWLAWRVVVADDYGPDTVKSVETLRRLEEDGALRVEPVIHDFGERDGDILGLEDVMLHLPPVLAGTTLAENGELMPDGVTPMLEIPVHVGWVGGYRMEFFDFSVSDGSFPDRNNSERRPVMPVANIYVHWRTCDDVPPAAICDIPGYFYPDKRPVSERGLGEDITGDNDANDTNNVVGSMPCEAGRADERPYSPLWRVHETFVTPGSVLSLVDTTGDQVLSDITSADDIFDAVALGLLTEPAAQAQDTTGAFVPGTNGEIFSNCPNAVPATYVPFPCSN